MEHAVKKLDRTIVWGCGINRDSLDGGYPSWLSECLAVGLRDAVPLYDWVPCASCLAFQFDDFRRTTPKHPVVVYQHYERENIPILPDAPRFSNGSSFVGLDRTLDFLASGDAIVTNSYHGLYWGLLLGRRVISWAPKQPKYRLLHPAAVDLHHADDLPAALSSARPDRDFLETCRTANDKFFNMVKGFLLA